MKLSKLFPLVFVIALIPQMTTTILAQRPAAPRSDTQRPIAALDSVWTEELTWMEIRDALADGKTTAIILTGGVEENGPYVPTGKHNYILEFTGEEIARRLGNALVVPILRYEPGDPANSSSPGTLFLSPVTYKAVLSDLATSLKVQGFKNIIMLADSGGNLRSMQEVAETLSAAWAAETTTIHSVREYYGTKRIIDEKVLPEMGIVQESEGIHDNYRLTTVMMALDPEKVRFKQRIAAGKASINGISINPPERAIEIGKQNLELRISLTVEAIQKVIRGIGTEQQN